jgi:hypothetical protein
MYADILAAPFRGGTVCVAAVEAFVTALSVVVEPTTRRVARGAAALRAAHVSLRRPGALLLAAGNWLHAAHVVSAEAAWPRYKARASVISSVI